MDKIIVKDLKLFCYHGVNPEEKEDGQNIVFDIEGNPNSINCQRYVCTLITNISDIMKSVENE